MASASDYQSASDPKRGHHVINNGVRFVTKNIIDDFLRLNGLKYFQDKDFDKLDANGFIPYCSQLYISHQRALVPQISQEIEEMTVYTPEGKKHTESNARDFGDFIDLLRQTTGEFMNKMFQAKLKQEGLSEELTSLGSKIGEIVTNVNAEVYLDKQAKEWYLKISKDRSKIYDRCKVAVEDMFNEMNFKSGRRNLEMSVQFKWVEQLYAIHIQLSNSEPSIDPKTITLVPNGKGVPEFAVMLGHLNDKTKTGNLWTVVAHTKDWGDILGRFDEQINMCWYTHYDKEKDEDKEYRTDTFSFVVTCGARCVKESEIPTNALTIPGIFGMDRGPHAVIVSTSEGNILGKVESDVCRYFYQHKPKVESRKFAWIVKLQT